MKCVRLVFVLRLVDNFIAVTVTITVPSDAAFAAHILFHVEFLTLFLSFPLSRCHSAENLVVFSLILLTIFIYVWIWFWYN